MTYVIRVRLQQRKMMLSDERVVKHNISVPSFSFPATKEDRDGDADGCGASD